MRKVSSCYQYTYWHYITVQRLPVFPFSQFHAVFISPIGGAEWKFDGVFVQSTIIFHGCSPLSGIRRHGLHFLFLFKNVFFYSSLKSKHLWSVCFMGWVAGPDPLGSWLYVMSPPIKERTMQEHCAVKGVLYHLIPHSLFACLSRSLHPRNFVSL